jgi:hypothetical protein
MGSAKQKYIEDMDRIEANRGVAEEIMVRAGILQRCASCREVVDKAGIVHAESDLEPAFRIASAMFRDGDELVEGYDRRAVLDTINAIAADCAEDCQCTRRGDD